MLKLDSVKVSYGAIEAVKGVDLEVRAGEVVTMKDPEHFRRMLERFRLAPEALPR